MRAGAVGGCDDADGSAGDAVRVQNIRGYRGTSAAFAGGKSEIRNPKPEIRDTKLET